MQRVKILFVHANNYDVGGADYCLFKMVKELDQEVFDPLVLLSKPTAVTELYKKNNIRYLVQPIVRLQKTKNPFKLIRTLILIPASIKRIYDLIKSEEIKIVHSNDLLDFAGTYFNFCVRKILF